MILFSQPFRFEREMLTPLLGGLPFVEPQIYSGETCVVREPSIGRVIPDLIVAPASSKLSLLARPRLTFVHCHALAMAHTEAGVSVRRMQDELCVSENRATAVLEELLRKQLLLIQAEKALVSPSASLLGVSMVAVEVKMRRWREALKQAHSYMRFADRSIVVLDGNQVTVDNEVNNAFRAAGVGLFLQYGPMTLEAIAAANTPVMSAEKIWAFIKLARSHHWT